MHWRRPRRRDVSGGNAMSTEKYSHWRIDEDEHRSYMVMFRLC